jgi:Rrf2 family iron-sulfur cluster assembly transcriptional regulator
MKLSTKGRYAVIAMIELALHDKKGLLPLSDLGLAEDISISYLEQLFAKLRGADLVNGVRGPRGGYRLSRPAQEISLAEIVKAVDEHGELPRVAGAGQPVDRRQLTHALWHEVSRKIFTFLDDITLADVLRNSQAGTNDPSAAALLPEIRTRSATAL